MYNDTSQDTIKTLFKNQGLLDYLLRFEEYLDNSNLYVYDGWENGEVVEGPIVNRYDCEITLKFIKSEPLDPRGMLLFERHGTKLQIREDVELVPKTKIQDVNDFDPEHFGKPKMDKVPVVLVKFIVPRRLLDDGDITEYELLQQKEMEDLTSSSMQSEGGTPSDMNMAPPEGTM